jgi:hypothetical protein
MNEISCEKIETQIFQEYLRNNWTLLETRLPTRNRRSREKKPNPVLNVIIIALQADTVETRDFLSSLCGVLCVFFPSLRTKQQIIIQEPFLLHSSLYLCLFAIHFCRFCHIYSYLSLSGWTRLVGCWANFMQITKFLMINSSLFASFTLDCDFPQRMSSLHRPCRCDESICVHPPQDLSICRFKINRQSQSHSLRSKREETEKKNDRIMDLVQWFMHLYHESSIKILIKQQYCCVCFHSFQF